MITNNNNFNIQTDFKLGKIIYMINLLTDRLIK